MRRILVAVALTLVAVVPTQCGNPPPPIRGNEGTPCPKPPQGSLGASWTPGTVTDTYHRNAAGCTQIWMIQVDGRWFTVGAHLYEGCAVGMQWGPPSGSSWDPYRCWR